MKNTNHVNAINPMVWYAVFANEYKLDCNLCHCHSNFDFVRLELINAIKGHTIVVGDLELRFE